MIWPAGPPRFETTWEAGCFENRSPLSSLMNCLGSGAVGHLGTSCESFKSPQLFEPPFMLHMCAVKFRLKVTMATGAQKTLGFRDHDYFTCFGPTFLAWQKGLPGGGNCKLVSSAFKFLG